MESDDDFVCAEIRVENWNAVCCGYSSLKPAHIIGCRIVCTGDLMSSWHSVCVSGGLLVLRNCLITSSSGPSVVAQYLGTRVIMQACGVHDGAQGGILCVDGASMTLQQVHCCRNAAMGFELRDKGTAEVEDSHFYSNGHQGILAWKSAGRLVAKRCSIHSQHTESGVLVSEAEASLEECSIYGNGITGVVSQQKGVVSLSNCKIHDNCEGIMVQDSGAS
mmetsp:Transcript_2328/g.3646  ORF Transcript_2328/g.3646 Transcript_2328/m.3646 type:complete len:220 (-) Transcript_2328:109-768(-)